MSYGGKRRLTHSCITSVGVAVKEYSLHLDTLSFCCIFATTKENQENVLIIVVSLE